MVKLVDSKQNSEDGQMKRPKSHAATIRLRVKGFCDYPLRLYALPNFTRLPKLQRLSRNWVGLD